MSIYIDGVHVSNDLFPVPPTVAKCPECGGALTAEICEWEEDTGLATEGGLYLDCANEPDPDDPDYDATDHRHWQGEWQPVMDRVLAWARKHVRVTPAPGAAERKG